MASSLESLISKPVGNVFRRLAVRRRSASTGLFETTWQDLTEYVKSWGAFSSAVDDVRLNRFTHSGLNLVCRNDLGTFNPENNPSSFWYGYLSRYRTMVRIQSGYKDEDGVEKPTSSSQGIYLMDGEVQISAKSNEALLNCKSLVSVFSEVQSPDVAGLGATQTASDIITKIKNHTDGSGNAIFQQFITASAWSIQTTTINYNLATTTTLDGVTVWDLMGKLAESEGFIINVTRDGSFVFKNREPNTTTSSVILYGNAFPRPNIIAMTEYKESLDKYYNLFRLKWAPADTSTSYVSAGSTTTINPASPSWKYGSRLYDFENLFIATSSVAQTVADNLYNEFSSLKTELSLICKFLPQIEISDRVTLYYRSYGVIGATLWDNFDWDTGVWSEEGGENFDWTGVEFQVLSKRTDLMRFTTTLKLRQV